MIEDLTAIFLIKAIIFDASNPEKLNAFFINHSIIVSN